MVHESHAHGCERPVTLFGRETRSAKSFMAGTHRTCVPETTIAAYSRFMPDCGITRIADITGLDHIGLPVFTAIRPNSMTLATAQGKGLTEAAAKASAMMESFEWWHAENVDLPLRLLSARALACQANIADMAYLPERRRPLNLHEPVLWVEGFDIVASRPCWLPLEQVSIAQAEPVRAPFFQWSVNGLASGNHILEAVVHAVCELIERDSAHAWSAQNNPLVLRDGNINSAVQRRQVDLDTVADLDCRRILSLLDAADIGVAAWDITADTGVPAFCCQILERPSAGRMRQMMVTHGYGCHLSPAVALARALTEAVQTRTASIAGARDTWTRRVYAESRNPQWQEMLWREGAGRRGERSFTTYSDQSTATFEGDLHRLVAALAQIGIESMIAVDLTRPAMGIPVVKVVIPGLHGLRNGERKPSFAPDDIR
jgi:YcaO-like protein with predicted kinase domain